MCSTHRLPTRLLPAVQQCQLWAPSAYEDDACPPARHRSRSRQSRRRSVERSSFWRIGSTQPLCGFCWRLRAVQDDRTADAIPRRGSPPKHRDGSAGRSTCAWFPYRPARLTDQCSAGGDWRSLGADRMNFDIPGEIPGNIAGDIGTDQLACPAGAKPSPFNDERRADGDAVLTVDGAGGMTVSPTIRYTVRDTIDLCPGNCGTSLEQVATVPISQFEATGISGDVPFTVDFTVTPAPFVVTPTPSPAPPAPAPPAPAPPAPSR